MLQMLVIALVTNAMALAVAERHQVEIARRDQLQPILRAVRDALEQAGVEVQSTEQSMLPKSTVEVEAADGRKLLRLLDALDEQDDVDQVHANFDMRADVMEEAAA